MTLYCGIVETKFGQTFVASLNAKPVFVGFISSDESTFDDCRTELQKAYPSLTTIRDDEVIQKVGGEINALSTLAIASVSQLPGTDFQKGVWRALLEIPKGQTRTYTDIARIIKRPKSVRAVANAIGANPLSVLIPCHRVICSDGSLGGYRWGLAAKTRLLAYESTTAF